jgi:hypothetical protein
MPVTQRKHDDLPEDVRRQADAGPVVMPGYTVLSRRDRKRLQDHIDGLIASQRRSRHDDDEGVGLDELAERHGL